MPPPPKKMELCVNSALFLQITMGNYNKIGKFLHDLKELINDYKIEDN